jgi:hypothetical protein
VRQGDHAASEVPAQIARVCAIGGLEPLDGCARNRVEASASIIGDNVVDRVSRMQMTSSVLVKSNLERVWAFLADEKNAPRWDRSVARADLVSPPPLRVGSIVQTTAPSGMKQEFRVDEISAPHVLRFSLVRSLWFRTAQLTFTLAPVDDAVRITHDIAVAFRFPWALLVPVLALFNKRALATDLDSLRRALDEGHDLTARP